jgi:hypothetical protein
MTDPAPATAPTANSNNTPAASDLLKPLDAATMPATPEAWEKRRVELINSPRFREA